MTVGSCHRNKARDGEAFTCLSEAGGAGSGGKGNV